MSLCRVCMKPNPNVSFIKDRELLNQYEYVTQLTATPGDNLPEKLCKPCKTRLRAAFDFKKQVAKPKSFEPLLYYIPFFSF